MQKNSETLSFSREPSIKPRSEFRCKGGNN